VSRSSGSPKTTSVETTKEGSRTEWIWTPSTLAPRAATGPWISSSGRPSAGRRTAAIRSANSRAVPLGTSGLAALA